MPTDRPTTRRRGPEKDRWRTTRRRLEQERSRAAGQQLLFPWWFDKPRPVKKNGGPT
jgi:hypothetical protein